MNQNQFISVAFGGPPLEEGPWLFMSLIICSQMHQLKFQSKVG